MESLLTKGCSILIPTWNNLPYLRKCVESIIKNSTYRHQIILHINEGTDGTREWADQMGLAYSYSKENVGVCVAMNSAYKLAKRKLIAYFNDDMVALPLWDGELTSFVSRYGMTKDTWLSSTMIEPKGDNPCCLAPFNFGTDLESFREEELYSELPTLRTLKGITAGSTWPPNIIHRDLWDEVKGYSEEFSPGFGSDPDFAHKLYNAGVRNFVGVGSSLVYHFGCKTTKGKEFKHNDAEATFLRKYGYSISDFVDGVLKRGSVWRRS